MRQQSGAYVEESAKAGQRVAVRRTRLTSRIYFVTVGLHYDLVAIRLDKIQTSERLIIAGVQMLNSEIDGVAVHVVASSALRVLKDLLSANGKQFETELFKVALFEDAQRIIHRKPPVLPDHPTIDEITSRLVSRLRAGLISSVDEVELIWGEDDLRELVRRHVRPYDFARHADRAPDDTIDFKEFSPDYVLMLAIGAMSILSPSRPLAAEVEEFVERRWSDVES